MTDEVIDPRNPFLLKLFIDRVVIAVTAYRLWSTVCHQMAKRRYYFAKNHSSTIYTLGKVVCTQDATFLIKITNLHNSCSYSELAIPSTFAFPSDFKEKVLSLSSHIHLIPVQTQRIELDRDFTIHGVTSHCPPNRLFQSGGQGGVEDCSFYIRPDFNRQQSANKCRYRAYS